MFRTLNEIHSAPATRWCSRPLGFVVFTAFVVFMLLASLVVTAPASANNIKNDNGNSGCSLLNGQNPNDPVMAYQRQSLKAGVNNAAAWVMNQRVQPTTIVVTEGVAPIDVLIYDGFWNISPTPSICNKTWWTPADGGTVGTAYCDILAGQSCGRHRIYISNTFTDFYSDAVLNKKLLCHEIGHVIGLDHNEHVGHHSCLRSPPNGPNSRTKYSNHEVILINAEF